MRGNKATSSSKYWLNARHAHTCLNTYLLLSFYVLHIDEREKERESCLLFSIPFEFDIVQVLLLNSILPVVVRIFLRTESCANEFYNGVRVIDVYTCCRRQHIYIRIHLHKIPLCSVIHISYHQPIHRIFFFSFNAIEDLFLHHQEMYWYFFCPC